MYIDRNLKELLMNRLKYLEFQGNYSPTMGLINKTSLNPKYFKLKKHLAKNTEFSLDRRKANLQLKKLMPPYHKPSLLSQSSTLSPHKKYNSPTLITDPYKLPESPAIPYIENQSFQDIKPKTNTLPKLSIKTYKKSKLSDFCYIMEPTPSKLYDDLRHSLAKKKHFHPAKPAALSQSLEFSPSGRQIILSKNKHLKNLVTTFESFSSGQSSSSSLLN